MNEIDLKQMKMETLLTKLKETEAAIERAKANEDDVFLHSLEEFHNLIMMEYAARRT